jgi:dipeptidyl aminopeptidase/acylaminoacyl peptidase
LHRIAVLGAVVGLFLAATLPASAAPTPPSAADFARLPQISNVSVSPDGKHVAALTSLDGQSEVISVWNSDALSQKPYIIGASRVRFLSVRFLKNDRLLVETVQTFTYGDTREHLVKAYVTDLEGKNFKTLLPEARAGGSEVASFVDRLVDATIISTLPTDPQNVLVADNRLETNGDVYKVNVYSGAAARIEKGDEKVDSYQADLKGELRAKVEADFDGARIFLAQYIKNPETGRWEEHFRSYAKDRSITGIVAFTTDPNVVYVSTSNGGDHTGIYEYDIRQRKLLEPAFQHRIFDVDGVIESRAATDHGRVLGFTYEGVKQDVYWTDDKLGSYAAGLNQALGIKTRTQQWTDPGTGITAPIEVPDGPSVDIESFSDDLRYVIAKKSGPRDAGEYYLLTDGSKLALLGKAMPWIDKSALGDTTLVEYPARDGLMIPAYLTLPDKALFGPGPYPTLIEPHGGPWARDFLDWNPVGWTQYFAARGFAVMEPQFRGSEGWGKKLWHAGDGEWGQKMQDDKDDGVKWLIAQKIADPKRVAMFGYSYGGYAALAAAIRPNGLYQCTISGAGAGDLAEIERATFDNRFQREFQHPTIKGLDALAHAKEAQIPVFLYHGDRDQTVKIEQSRKFAAALKAAGKPYKLLEIPDMGHQYIFMTPPMVQEQLTAIDDWLKTGCKPGGL